MTWVATAVALVTAAAAAYNTKETARKADRTQASAIRNQSKLQEEQDAKVLKTVQDLSQSSSGAERATAEDAYLEKVRQAQGMARANLDAGTGVLSAYDEAAGRANTTAQGYAEKIAGLMARMDAPVNQRMGEGFKFGDLSTDIGLGKRASSGQAWIDQLRAAGIRRNPYIDLAAAAGNAYAGAKTGGGSAAPSGGGTTEWGAFGPGAAGWTGVN